MLRSRVNRSQRPSEPSDERSSSGYGGYPSASHMAIGGGDGEGYHSSGYGGGGYSYQGYDQQQQYSKGHPVRSTYSSTSSNPFRDSKSTTTSPTKHMWHCFLFVLLLALSASTFLQYRTYTRTTSQLTSVLHHLKNHPIQQIDDDQHEQLSPSDESDHQKEQAAWQHQLHSLTSSQNQLKEALGHLTSHQLPRINSEISSVTHQIEAVKRENDAHSSQLDTLRNQQKVVKEEIEDLKKEYIHKHTSPEGKLLIPAAGSGNRVEAKSAEKSIDSLEELEEYVKKREDVLWGKIDVLMESMKSMAKFEVEEWFGPGPHKVELEIEYPKYTEDLDASEWPRVRGVFLIELAPLDLMPVAVNLFLQQVHHKLWNGCSFVINAMHIMQAGPHEYANNKYSANHESLVDRFNEMKLDKMPFQEYHESYPHEKYTLGFAGRPAGPDFYINKIANVENHGPGGQVNHDLHEEADPCFGKIIQGTELIYEINKIPVGYDQGSLLQQHVKIVDARVVTEQRNPLKEHEHGEEDGAQHRGELRDEGDNQQPPAGAADQTVEQTIPRH